ncbi:MAG TPA: hypothetical protein VG276_23645 [Actinomycetes bacterium]|jgi:hypothetical protein|nr:hypothetical protein [Actinomycetes bacterium]
MAVIFLLLAIGVGAAIGDAVYESTDPGTLTILQQTTGRFSQGQLLAIFAGLGFLLALLLLLAGSSTRRRRTRRKELRTARQDMEDRVAELERDNARLHNDLARWDQAVADRDAALAHRDQLLAYKDEELARLLHRARQAPAPDRPRPPADTTTAVIPDRSQYWHGPEDAQETGSAAARRDRPTRQLDPGRDDPANPRWAGPEGTPRPTRRPGGTT